MVRREVATFQNWDIPQKILKCALSEIESEAGIQVSCSKQAYVYYCETTLFIKLLHADNVGKVGK